MAEHNSLNTARSLCSGVGWTYFIVVEIDSWPINSFKVGRSTPAITAREP